MADYWRGVRICSCMVAPLSELGKNVTKRCSQQRIPDFFVSPIQGSYSTGTAASAGTHAGGGALDVTTAKLSLAQKGVLEYCLREIGFASWNREPTWFSQWFGRVIKGGWSPHNHSVLNGCSHLATAAKSQIDEYKRGENGLAGKDKDTGVRSFVGRTWAAYLQIKAGVGTIAQQALNAGKVKAIQAALRQKQDGRWGTVTDQFLWRAFTARQQGRAFFIKYDVKTRKALQGSWGATPVDGLWGPRTQAANVATIKRIQKALGVPQDGVWGAVSMKAYRELRAKVFRP